MIIRSPAIGLLFLATVCGCIVIADGGDDSSRADAGPTSSDAGPNNAPTASAGDLQITRADGTVPWPRTFSGTAYLSATYCDAEADVILVEVEFVPEGQLFQSVPTFTFEITPTWRRDETVCGSVLAPLTGIAPGTYQGRVRFYDARGAESYGWGRSAAIDFTLLPGDQ